MAATRGNVCAFKVGATAVTLMGRYTLNRNIETVDISALGSSFRTRAQTMKDWNFTVDGVYDRSDTNAAAMMDYFENGTLGNVAARFYVVSAPYYSGNAVLDSNPINVDLGDVIRTSFSGAGNGALSYSTSS